MNNQNIEYKAKEYVYELGNAALENGFKPDEKWQLSLVSMADKAAIEKKYHPTVFVMAAQENILAIFTLVKEKLKQSPGPEINIKTVQLDALQYLIAYNLERERR